MKLGLCLKCYRNKYDVDIYTLARDLEISVSTLSRLENGKSVDLFSFQKIFNWLLYTPPEGEL